MTFQRFDIAPGAAVSTVGTDAFKTATLIFNLVVPMKKETAAANALLTYVLDRGCRTYPTQGAIACALEELYSSSIAYRVYKTGEWQVIAVAADMLDSTYAFDGMDIFGKTMEVFSAVLTDPLLENGAFRSDYVETEKKNLKDQIRAKINSKDAYAIHRCRTVMCEGEAYGCSELGDVEDVEAITSESLTRAYRELLATARIEVFYVGNEQAERVRDTVSAMLMNIPRAYAAPTPFEKIRFPKGAVRQVREPVQAVQGKLAMGFRTGAFVGEAACAAMPMLVQLLSAAPTSKLFMNVREKLSLCYYCSAAIDSFKGVMFVYSGIENGNKNAAEKEILHQIQELCQGNITEEEWHSARCALEGNHRALADSPAALCHFYLNRAISGDYLSPEALLSRSLSATKEDVIALAQGIRLDTVYFLCGVGTDETEDDADEE